MPVQRTKALKRDDSCNQIVWSAHEPMTTILPSATIVDANDCPPPLVDRPTTEFILFPPPTDLLSSTSSSQSTTTTKRQPHSKKKPENHIPRPPNAFILFRSSFIKSQHVSTEVETNHSTLSKIIGITWQNLPEDERQIWHAKAKDALEDHKRRFPKYAFRPVQTKSKSAGSANSGGGGGGGGGNGGHAPEKRKVREVEPKDLKRCTKIAELLVKGKKGASLKEAIAEFDKTHVPEIITRFETPITAKAFRRSSSAPVPDVEEQGQGQGMFFVNEQPKAAKKARKPRASSTQPTMTTTPAPVVAPVEIIQHVNVPLKQENSFSFDDFTFTPLASPISPLSPVPVECDPFFLPPSPVSFPTSSIHSPLPIPLSIDTSFVGMGLPQHHQHQHQLHAHQNFNMHQHQWSPLSSPPTPTDLQMDAIDMELALRGSPTPSFSSSSFDAAPSPLSMDMNFDAFTGFEAQDHIQQNISVCGQHQQYAQGPAVYDPSAQLELDFASYIHVGAHGMPAYGM